MKTRKPLSAKTPLKAKTALKARTGLKANLKPKKQPVNKISKLTKEADRWFSWAVRLRDSSLVDGAWQGECITCDKTILVRDANGKWKHTSNIGHFITRSCKILRFDSENGNIQCVHCNAWRDKESMQEAYRLALDLKYGNGTAAKLKEMSKQDFRLTIPYLQEVITNSKEEVQFYLETIPNH